MISGLLNKLTLKNHTLVYSFFFFCVTKLMSFWKSNAKLPLQKEVIIMCEKFCGSVCIYFFLTLNKPPKLQHISSVLLVINGFEFATKIATILNFYACLLLFLFFLVSIISFFFLLFPFMFFFFFLNILSDF